eukprot:GHRR01035375.1.p1 GENE.GHRR01035375.1~~GHRR01035375.1.p1  ORF type:complete len:307 (+),score=99.06 GHRR01035375.1:437-1357(+)
MPTAAMVPAAEQPTLDDCSSTGLVAAASEQQHLLQLELGSSGSSEGVTSKFAKQTGSNSKQQFSASDGSSKLDPGSPTAAALNDLPAGVDNPDQRITADVSSFVATSVGLALLLGKKFLNCAAFAGEHCWQERIACHTSDCTTAWPVPDVHRLLPERLSLATCYHLSNIAVSRCSHSTKYKMPATPNCLQAIAAIICIAMLPLVAAGVLWSISPRLVVFLISYALMGTFGTAAIFGRPLTRLQQLILRLEADLRFGLVRLRWVHEWVCDCAASDDCCFVVATEASTILIVHSAAMTTACTRDEQMV